MHIWGKSEQFKWEILNPQHDIVLFSFGSCASIFKSTKPTFVPTLFYLILNIISNTEGWYNHSSHDDSEIIGTDLYSVS